MKKLLAKLITGFLITLFTLPAFAWQVMLKPSDADKTINDVIVGTDRSLQGLKAYLTWYDQDAVSSDEAFWSWTIADKWERGIIPVSQEPLDVPAFTARKITTLSRPCPEGHRCFLAMVAVNPEDNPVDLSTWQASSFLPLSFSAGCERWPGQQVFLSCDENKNEEARIESDGALNGMTGEPAPSAVADESGAPGGVETEKPDIFKLVGNKLLYANGMAEKFQVIDISDVSNPRLETWLPLSGSPREIYVFDNFYVLLQTNYNSEEGTKLSVLTQDGSGKLQVVQEMTLSGWFLESRRRNDVIYSVVQDYTVVDSTVSSTETGADIMCLDCIYNESVITITALRFNAGRLEKVDDAQVLGYYAITAIFPDYLAIANHNPRETNWETTQIQLFDLSQSDPLVELPTLTVPGQIPSEFHLSVMGQQFRVVYGPENRESGSSLAIYDLSSPNLALLGKVEGIAPGESLFATRFVDNRAFMVTFERTDPLWVIDLSDARNPKILGELLVPGWSEKLFFHEDKLFAVGTDNQPTEAEGERWVNRVAMSLFDVADPTNPTLIQRFTPFAGQVDYTWSPATGDERALLLDWEEEFAALPIMAYGMENNSYLQIVSLANDTLNDAGNLGSTTSIQRSLSIEPNVLAALGDQALTTLRWGDGKPQRLGELELAANLQWLNSDIENGGLWAASMGDMGYHRFYHFSLDDIENSDRSVSLPKSYNNVQRDGESVVFYNYSPLAVRVMDIQTGELSEEQVLEDSNMDVVENVEAVKLSSGFADEPMIVSSWYSRNEPFVQDGIFYVTEWRAVRADGLAFMSNETSEEIWQNRWVLRRWDLKNGAAEMPALSIPGSSVAFTDEGQLITQESTDDGQLRLNLLALDESSARLMGSRDLPCQSYSMLKLVDDGLYVTCQKQVEYYPPYYRDYPMLMEGVTPEGTETTATSNTESPETVMVDELGESDTLNSTQVLKLNPADNFAEIGNWTVEGHQQIRAAKSDIVLMNSEYYGGIYYYGGMVDDVMIEPAPARMSMMPPYYQMGCDVYRLTPAQEPELLKHLDTDCPYNEAGTVLTDTQLWTVEGFTGIKNIPFTQ